MEADFQAGGKKNLVLLLPVPQMQWGPIFQGERKETRKPEGSQGIQANGDGMRVGQAISSLEKDIEALGVVRGILEKQNREMCQIRIPLPSGMACLDFPPTMKSEDWALLRQYFELMERARPGTYFEPADEGADPQERGTA